MARHLVHRGHEVWIDLMADASKLAGDAAVNHAIVEKMGVPIRPLTDLSALPDGGRTMAGGGRDRGRPAGDRLHRARSASPWPR